MIDEPLAEDMGVSKKDMETPEQRKREVKTGLEDNERAERLEQFRPIAEGLLDHYFEEGKISFGIDREEATEIVTGRIFDQVEASKLEVDYTYLQRITEVLAAINEGSKEPYEMTRATLEVIEYHLQVAAGEQPEPTIYTYLEGEMDKRLKKTTGVGLAEWAQEYHKVHGDETRSPEDNLAFIDITEADYNAHVQSESNLRRIFTEFAESEGIEQLDPQTALQLLRERGFVVPEEWKEEYAENDDGARIIEVIHGLERKMQFDDISASIEGGYEFLTPEEKANTPVTVSNFLEAASLEGAVPESWADCDGQLKQIIKNKMKEIADHLGGKLGTAKGEPIVRFK